MASAGLEDGVWDFASELCLFTTTPTADLLPFQLAARVEGDPQLGGDQEPIHLPSKNVWGVGESEWLAGSRRWCGQQMATGFWWISSIFGYLIASLIDSTLRGCIILLVLEFKN